jgi:glutathione peroxidase
MDRRIFLLQASALPLILLAGKASGAPDYFELPLRDIEGRTGTLGAFAGKVLLIVNVASRCGYTRQYEGLEELYQAYKAQGLVVLGFPCNDFGAQEPASEKEIQKFCKAEYGVTFPMFGKVGIRTKPHPLFAALTDSSSPLPGPVQWNFNKFLLGRDGVLKARFDSTDEPDSGPLKAAIEKALSAPAPSPINAPVSEAKKR